MPEYLVKYTLEEPIMMTRHYEQRITADTKLAALVKAVNQPYDGEIINSEEGLHIEKGTVVAADYHVQLNANDVEEVATDP